MKMQVRKWSVICVASTAGLFLVQTHTEHFQGTQCSVQGISSPVSLKFGSDGGEQIWRAQTSMLG